VLLEAQPALDLAGLSADRFLVRLEEARKWWLNR